MAKQNNYNKYWKNWNVLQTPKIDMDLLSESGWEVYDVNFNNNCSTVAKNEGYEIRADYSLTGGVNNIRVKNGDNIVYEQRFNFLLKPTVNEIKRAIEAAGIQDWQKFYTAC